jgi:hypothetical protein
MVFKVRVSPILVSYSVFLGLFHVDMLLKFEFLLGKKKDSGFSQEPPLHLCGWSKAKPFMAGGNAQDSLLHALSLIFKAHGGSSVTYRGVSLV